MAESQTYDVSMVLTVSMQVTVADPSAIRRVVENEDGWRESYYPLKTATDVINHLAFNCAVNGVEDASELDGWADLPRGAVTMVAIERESEDSYITPDPDAAEPATPAAEEGEHG